MNDTDATSIMSEQDERKERGISLSNAVESIPHGGSCQPSLGKAIASNWKHITRRIGISSRDPAAGKGAYLGASAEQVTLSLYTDVQRRGGSARGSVFWSP